MTKNTATELAYITVTVTRFRSAD